MNGGLQKWPPVYYHDIANYLDGINTPDNLLHCLNRTVKQEKVTGILHVILPRRFLLQSFFETLQYCDE